MGTYIVAGNRARVAAGQMIAVKLEGTDVLLANIEGNIYAMANKCPHMGGNLSKGTLTGRVVTCPVHGSQFDVTTGKNLRWMKGAGLLYSIGKVFKSPTDAMTYPVKLDGQQILVEI
jgi:3-phenylpropionate/trans-cinnamate dioxygenase ferredoxin component